MTAPTRPEPAQGPEPTQTPEPTQAPAPNRRVSRAALGLSGAALVPVLILFTINFFDQFDTAAFNVLAPEIKKAFHLSTAGISAISAVNLLFTTTFVLAIGWWADRTERRNLVVWSGVVAGLTSFFTGAAVGLWVAVLLRLGNGVGLLHNAPAPTSLLTDYSPAEQRPQVFSIPRSAEPWGQ